ncbi:MAG: hypothetical protein M1144_02965 [Candidatus Thermoplasmatota archaeon]|nr:hypothetical protein [Candidatus Thermoplasmatota archaeon]
MSAQPLPPPPPPPVGYPMVYVPVAPPPKEDHVALIVVLLIIFLVVIPVILAAILFGMVSSLLSTGGGVPTGTVTVQDVTQSVTYTGSTTGYLTFAPSCPLTVSANSVFACTEYVNNTAIVAHQLTAITVSSPFQLQSTTPAVPFGLPPQHVTAVTLDLRAPSTSGTYTLSLVLTSN